MAKTVKRYQFKGVPLKTNIGFSVGLLLVVIALVCYSVSKNSPVAVTGIIALVFTPFLFTSYHAVRLDLQYLRFDKGKEITIDESRTSLTVTQGSTITTIAAADVKRVTFFHQKDWGKLLGRYGYMVIYTESGHLLVTQFTIPRLEWDPVLSRFLSKKPRTHFTKRINYIYRQPVG